MITVDDKMLITVPINKLILRYSTVLYRDLLNKIVLCENGTQKSNFTDLFKKIKEGCNSIGEFEDADVKFELDNTINGYLEKLDVADLTAFYFYYLNKEVLSNLESYKSEYLEFMDESKSIDAAIGRFVAYKLYEPETSSLNQGLLNLLEQEIVLLAIEYDFSIDDYFLPDIKESIEKHLIFYSCKTI